MTQRLERESQLWKKQYPEIAGELHKLAVRAKDLGAPKNFLSAKPLEVYPEISLEEEFERQAKRYLELGFS